ncbi:MAG: dihydrodipicolinate synthase family protein, partial [Sedimentisphaerales bacterium]|nr:dihydrodipicolinate synthase family protein [Sedimentisphaerales bacterium]
MNDRNKPLFRGIIVPLVTPLAEPDVPDIQQFQGLIDHVIARQVHGILILGTTGEALSLNSSIRRQIIEAVCRYTAGRTMVCVGIINTELSEATALAHIAAENRADGIFLAEPYFPITQDAVLEYTQAFAQKCPLPVCLYNRPDQDIVFQIETVKKFLSFEKIAAIKDSSGDLNYFKELIQLKNIRPDWSVLMGLEKLLAEAIRAGADGGVTGGANLFPDLYVGLYNAAVQKKISEIERLQKMVMAVIENIYQPEYLAGLKYALSCKQLCREILAEPPYAAGPEQQKRIRQFLE